MRKKFNNAVFTLLLAGVMICSFGTLAQAATGRYNAFILDYNCTLKSSYGQAKTGGAVYPYYNYATVVVYKNGTSKGLATSYGKNAATANAKKTGSGLTRAKSYHAVTYQDKTHIEPWVEQLTLEVP